MNKETKEQKKERKVIYLTIGCSLLILITGLFSPFIFTRIAITSSLDFSNTGNIGDTIGGIMNPFIGLVGILITFLAFYIQWSANKMQINLINKNREEQNSLLKEQLFFRLLDNINMKVVEFNYDNENGYDALNIFIGHINQKSDLLLIDLGKKIICDQPEMIEEKYYNYFVRNTPIQNIRNGIDFKQKIISKKNYNNRYEFLKECFHVNNKEVTDKGLIDIGRVYFYKIKFEAKIDFYEKYCINIYEDKEGFISSYLKNASYLIDFIYKNKENTDFITYYKGNLSSQEVMILYYLCASYRVDINLKSKIRELNILDEIYPFKSKLTDSPSTDELKIEINTILNHDFN